MYRFTSKMKCIRSVLHLLFSLIGFFIRPLLKIIFSFIYDKESKCVSPIRDDNCLKSATELARMIRARKVKAVDVMQSFIDRAKETNRDCNFIVEERFSAALKEAKEVDVILDSKQINRTYSEENKPFLGVPTSVKEAFALSGMSQTSGLVMIKDFKASQDAPVVARMKEAGFIPYMVTNVSELCMWYESANRLYGRTKNPYNTGRIVGGSSGGEGCAIASGAAVVGIGSDIGGSIRMPSFFNGIFGHKPSRGIVPNEGQFPLPTGRDIELLTSGPMCRYAKDLLPLLKIMAGPQCRQVKLDQKVDIKTLKFYTMADDGGGLLVSDMQPELRDAQQKVVDYLRNNLQVSVETIHFNKMKYGFEMWSAKMAMSGGTPFSGYMANFNGRVNCYIEFFKWIAGCSNHTLPAIALGAVESLAKFTPRSNEIMVQILQKLDQELKALLGSNGVLIYPSHSKVALYHNEPLLYPFNFAYTGIFNALAYPVTQCPLGLGTEGLPLGIQLVTVPNNDRLTIAVAEFLEDVFGGWVPPGLRTNS